MAEDSPTAAKELAMRSRSLPALALIVAAAVALPLAADPKGKPAGPKGASGKKESHHGARATVVVYKGFPLARPLPRVVVRPPGAAIRVAPRVFLRPAVFPAAVVRVRPAPVAVVWSRDERFLRDDDWTEVALNVNRDGARLYFEIADGPALIGFAEVVYDDGEAQVIDFADQVYPPGFYGLLELPQPRVIDHVRLVAAASDEAVVLGLDLTL
jgi:hypothetical protein